MHDSGIKDLHVTDIKTVPLCGNRADFDPKIHEDCLSVGYGFIGDYKSVKDPHYDRYHSLMKIFAKNNGLDYGKDVKPLTAGN